MMRIVLVQPPIRDFYLTRKRTLPYGLRSVAASLEAAGYEAIILDGLASRKKRPLPWPDNFQHMAPFYGRSDITRFSLFHGYSHFGYSPEHLARQVRNLTPQLIGISSLFTAYHDMAEATARTIRSLNPGIPIVMGGHHPTRFPESVLADPSVDYVLRGEGEDTLPLLCRFLREGSPALSDIPGIAFRTNDTLRMNPPHFIKDLSGLPAPLPRQPLPEWYRRNNQQAIVVVSSRGCPLRCSYCAVSARTDHGGFRKRFVSAVLEEIRVQADRQDIGFIDFEDENISCDRNWFEALLTGIRSIFAGRPVELRAMNGLYPPSLDPNLVGRMAEAGFRTLNLSVGSFSTHQLRRFCRQDVTQAHDRVVAAARNHGLTCVSYLIAAAPGQSAKASLTDLLELAQRPTLAGLSIFYPAPGSADYEHCRDAGILPDHFSLMRSSVYPIDHTTTRVQAVTLMRLSRILNYLKQRIDGEDPEPGDTRGHISDGLCRRFLDDALIRGMDSRLQVYDHVADLELARSFVRELTYMPLMGTIRGPVTLNDIRNRLQPGPFPIYRADSGGS